MSSLVSVDIGGTHARFADVEFDENGSIGLGEPVTLQTRDYASFQTAWEHYLETRGGEAPEAAAIAIAAPIEGEVIRFTNNPWIIRPGLVCEKLGVERFVLVNDFAAVAHAVARAPNEEFTHLCGPDIALPDDGVISVIGPGTGLGVAHLWRDGTGNYRVNATEGGHAGFAPLDSIEDAILARLRKSHSRVSVERVVSGPGIVEIFHALAAMEHRAVEELEDRAIWQLGISGEDSLASAAVDRFCLSLGAVAGDLALAQGANGVVIAGGLGYRIRNTLLKSGFSERFCAKGRFEAKMAAIPVKLIVHPQPGLHGAAAAFYQEHHSG